MNNRMGGISSTPRKRKIKHDSFTIPTGRDLTNSESRNSSLNEGDNDDGSSSNGKRVILPSLIKCTLHKCPVCGFESKFSFSVGRHLRIHKEEYSKIIDGTLRVPGISIRKPTEIPRTRGPNKIKVNTSTSNLSSEPKQRRKQTLINRDMLPISSFSSSSSSSTALFHNYLYQDHSAQPPVSTRQPFKPFHSSYQNEHFFHNERLPKLDLYSNSVGNDHVIVPHDESVGPKRRGSKTKKLQNPEEEDDDDDETNQTIVECLKQLTPEEYEDYRRTAPGSEHLAIDFSYLNAIHNQPPVFTQQPFHTSYQNGNLVLDNMSSNVGSERAESISDMSCHGYELRKKSPLVLDDNDAYFNADSIPERNLQPQVYFNSNLRKIKIENDYAPIKKEPNQNVNQNIDHEKNDNDSGNEVVEINSTPFSVESRNNNFSSAENDDDADNQEFQMLDSERGQLQQEADDNKNTTEEKEEELKMISNLEEGIKNYTQKILSLCREKTENQTTLQNQVDQLNLVIGQLKTQVDDLNSTVTVQRDENNRLQSQLVEKEKQIEELNNKLKLSAKNQKSIGNSNEPNQNPVQIRDFPPKIDAEPLKSALGSNVPIIIIN